MRFIPEARWQLLPRKKVLGKQRGSGNPK